MLHLSSKTNAVASTISPSHINDPFGLAGYMKSMLHKNQKCLFLGNAQKHLIRINKLAL